MIQSQNNAVTYAVSGNEYLFPYKFFNPSDLTLYLDSRILVKDIDWTIENKEDYSGGAKIFLKEGVQGKRLTIMRILACTQGASFPTYGKLDSKSLENALDKLTMIAQQIQEENSRTIKTSPTDETTADALLQSIYTSANGAVAAAAAAGESAQQAALTAKTVEDAGKAAVDAASEAAGSAAEVREALQKSAGIQIGAVYSSPGAVPPEGTYLLNGQTIPNCAETYKTFWAWVQSAGVRIIDNATFEAELAQYGNCDGFVVDTAAGSVRLPKWKYQAPLGDTLKVRGNGMSIGLTDGTAFIGIHERSGNPSVIDGAKELYGSAVGTSVSSGAGIDNNKSLGVTSDPDISGIVAENNAPADHFVWCIQVYNAATALSKQESAQLAILMQTKAQTDLANITNAGKNVIRKESAMRVWESGEQSITNSTLYQLTHNLNLTEAEIRKARARVILKCVIAEHGYQAGDIISDFSEGITNQGDYAVTPTVRSNTIAFRKGSGSFIVIPLSEAYWKYLTNANWKIIFQIFY